MNRNENWINCSRLIQINRGKKGWSQGLLTDEADFSKKVKGSKVRVITRRLFGFNFGGAFIPILKALIYFIFDISIFFRWNILSPVKSADKNLTDQATL